MIDNHIYAESQAAPASVTILTSEGVLTKSFNMVNGQVKKASHANLVRGTFAVREVHSLKELDVLMDALTPYQAMTYGRPLPDKGIIVAQKVPNPPEGAITRTRANFSFPHGPGILMLDYDPVKDGEAMSAEELIAMVEKAMPELTGVAKLWRPSSSSGVAGAGIRGQRVYMVVSDAKLIPEIGEMLFKRLWLAGFGYYKVSESGQVLERTPIDASVWQPERMDFAAAPVVAADIPRTRYDSMIIDGCIFEVKEMKALAAEEDAQLKAIKQAEREAMQPQIQVAKLDFVSKMTAEMPKRLKAMNIDADVDSVGAMVERATMQNVLMGNWPLTTSEGKSVTVGEILDNPKTYHQTRFADPLEPDDDKRVAYAVLYTRGRPYIYTHKHHGVRYALERAPATILVASAELPRMVDAAAEIIKKAGEMYEHAGTMVYVNEDNKIVHAKAQWMHVAIQRLCRFETFDKNAQELKPVPCPTAVVNGLLANGASVRMDKLTAVRNAPTIDHDGRQIVAPGYDSQTGLLLVNDANVSWPDSPKAPTREDLRAAFNALWMPFKQFPYATEADKSVALAAVLTTAARSCLRTSPGFGFSATAPGTGKTLLGQCIGALYDGVAPAITPPCPSEDDWNKTLFSAALGGAGTMLFDNAEYPIESASLCAVTTAPAIKNRILRESRDEEAEHRMLILATGNGLQFVGDLNRRFFVCRLDAKMEASQVAAREFTLNPLNYCLKNRISMVTAALTLIQGYVHAGFPRVCDGLASMDDWNKLVRSTIVWLIKQGILDDFVDPKEALMRDSANDPVANTLAGLLETAKTIFGTGKHFTVAELISRVKGSMIDALDLLMDIAGERGDIDSRKLGRWLLKYEGRVVGDLRIKRGPATREKTATWEVSTV